MGPQQQPGGQQPSQTQPSQQGAQVPQASPPAQGDEPRVMSPDEARQELKEAIQGSSEVLASSTTAFKIFPDTLTLDRAKLTVTKRTFFSTAEVVSIRIEDVLNVTAQVGPILGSIKIVSRVMSADKPYEIHGFWRNDAIKLKRVTQGYVIALQRQIDCSNLPTRELANMLEKLGEDNHTNI